MNRNLAKNLVGLLILGLAGYAIYPLLVGGDCGIYETYMYYWMQTVIAPIRVDLPLIVPMLYVVTIVGTAVLKWPKNPTGKNEYNRA